LTIVSRKYFKRLFPIISLEKTMLQLLSRLAHVLSFVAFAVALTQDCFFTDSPDPRTWSPGWVLLALGWVGIFSGETAWIANPMLFLAWASCEIGKIKVSLIFAAISLAFMVPLGLRKRIISKESSTFSKITGFGPGYWLWCTSGILELVSAAVGVEIL
jgi:hypothetical protein